MAVRSMERSLKKWQLDSKFLHGPQNHWEKVQLVHLCGMCVIQFSGLVWLVVLFNLAFPSLMTLKVRTELLCIQIRLTELEHVHVC